MTSEAAIRKSRGGYRAAVTKACNLLNELMRETEFSELDEFELEDLLEQIEKRELTVAQADEDLKKVLKEDKIEEFTEEQIEWQDKITELKRKARVYVKRQKAARESPRPSSIDVIPASTTSLPSVSSRGVKLPKLEVKKFNGDIADWQRFWDQFQQAVHLNKTLDDVSKFSYLRSMLEGTALDAIAGLLMTSANYIGAIDTLKDRFGRKELVIHFHMAKLLKMTAVRENTADPRALRRLYDECISHIKGLEALGITSKSYGCLLCPVVMQLVPEELIVDWRRKATSRIELYDLDTLLGKLKAEVEGKEDLMFIRKDGKGSVSKSTYKVTEESPLPSTALLHARVESQSRTESTNGNGCVFCAKDDHKSAACKISLSVNEKKARILKGGCCFVCLGKRHMAKECRSTNFCRRCNGRHHTQICFRKNSSPSTKEKESEPLQDKSPIEENKVSLQACVSSTTQAKFTQLQIIWAWAEGNLGRCKVRCVLDNGSQRSFVRVHTSKRTGAERIKKEHLTVSGIGGRKEEHDFNLVKLTLRSLYDDNEKTVELIEINSICGPVESLSPKETTRLLHKVGLEQDAVTEDVEESTTTIDVLIGQDIFWTIVTGQYRRLNESAVVMQSLFGWSIEGKVSQQDKSTELSTVLHCTVQESKQDEWAEKLWSLEAIGIKDSAVEQQKQVDDDEVHRRFKATTDFKEGRYCVRLPWKTDVSRLGTNWTIARERMMGLIRRFESDPDFFLKYKAAIEAYMQQGHAEEVCAEQEVGEKVYYIPHHAVVREDRVTTKVRIVFDASAHKKTEESLNECLWSGPNLNPELVHLLLVFRMQRIALTADIEKAFLQVSLAEEDRDATRFLWVDPSWRIGDKVKLKVFRMTRVLFGASCSPYLLAATLRFHAEKEANAYPQESKLLNKNSYVDDLVGGAACEKSADTTKENMQSMLKGAGMKMKKWLTNDTKLFEKWKSEEVQNNTLEELNVQPNQNVTKVLGLKWDPKLDELMLPVTVLESLNTCPSITKRVVLKHAAQIYDPLGFIAPVVMKARCLFQELWKQKFTWDQELPMDLNHKWKSWCSDIQQLDKIKLPRYISLDNELRSRRQMHVFCDSSEKAYGTVIYLRMESQQEVNSSLLICKGRVAPIKQISLPRLELMSATIGARLAAYVTQREEFAGISYTFWSDSQVVLKWIRGIDKKWKVFVQNRVTEIRSLTNIENWRYCPSKENPADLISRGETLTKLLSSTQWWKGPAWLLKKEEEWPQENEENLRLSQGQVEDEEKVIVGVTIILEELIDLQRYGHLEKAVRVTAWVLRAASIFKGQVSGEPESLTVTELNDAMTYLIRQTQMICYQSEIYALKKEGVIDAKQSKIANLNPFLDELGVMRMGGRLHESSLPVNEKHPILLPSKTRFAQLLVLECHEKVFHGGVVRTLAKLRESYWLVKARQFVKKTLNLCFICRKLKAKPLSCIEANLPKERLTPARPFSSTGIDFAGPVFVKEKGKQSKAYITLFTCAVTRAVHLELVPDLTTEAFLRALRRFFARRGVSALIYSDNAKTFKRANLELTWIWELVTNPLVNIFCAKQRVEWKFIAAKAAWWGGFWERMIQTVKRCLRKVLGKSCVSSDELTTILTEIETVVNQRPISYVSDEPQTEEPLTPAHFLNCSPDSLIAVGRVKQSSECKVDKDFTRNWRHRQQLLEHFWRRWKAEYLLDLKSLQQRRNVGKKAVIKPGDVVLIHEFRQPRHMWKMARVKEVQLGRDGQIRSCLLKLGNGHEMRRPIQLVYSLEHELDGSGGV